jgi:hypothetical protein
MSFRNPVGRVCLPRAHTAPSTSRATFAGTHAKSNRHFLVAWKRCSVTGSGIPNRRQSPKNTPLELGGSVLYQRSAQRREPFLCLPFLD